MKKPVLLFVLLLWIALVMLGAEPGAHADPDHYDHWDCYYIPAWVHSGELGILPSSSRSGNLADHDPFAPCKMDHIVDPTLTPTLEPTVTETAEPTLTPTLEPTLTPTLEPTLTPTLECDDIGDECIDRGCEWDPIREIWFNCDW